MQVVHHLKPRLGRIPVDGRQGAQSLKLPLVLKIEAGFNQPFGCDLDGQLPKSFRAGKDERRQLLGQRHELLRAGRLAIDGSSPDQSSAPFFHTYRKPASTSTMKISISTNAAILNSRNTTTQGYKKTTLISKTMNSIPTR